MTEIFILKNPAESLTEEGTYYLPRWRRRRMERLHYAPAREASLGAGLLWRYAVEKHGVEPEEPVRFLQAGKPVFARREDLHFSLSHSGPYAMCAISDHEIGADVQQPAGSTSGSGTGWRSSPMRNRTGTSSASGPVKKRGSRR